MQSPPTEEMLTHVAARFRALADETRLRLLIALQDGEKNVATLVEQTGVAQASVSKHLGVLKTAGLVESRRDGASAFYSVRDQSIYEMCDIVCDGVRRHVSETHAALGLDEPAPRIPRRSRDAD